MLPDSGTSGTGLDLPVDDLAVDRAGSAIAVALHAVSCTGERGEEVVAPGAGAGQHRWVSQPITRGCQGGGRGGLLVSEVDQQHTATLVATSEGSRWLRGNRQRQRRDHRDRRAALGPSGRCPAALRGRRANRAGLPVIDREPRWQGSRQEGRRLQPFNVDGEGWEVDCAVAVDDEEALIAALDKASAPASIRSVVLRAAEGARKSKRHHYVPVSYLQGWLGEDENVTVWDTTTGKVYETNPINVCLERDFYTGMLEDGTKTRLMEGLLAELDAGFARRIRQVTESDSLPESARDRAYLALDVAIQEGRQPQRRRMMASMATTLGRTLVGAELERHGLDPGSLSATIDGGTHVQLMLNTAFEAAPLIAASSWTLHVADRDVFATCDVPVLYDYTAAPDMQLLSGTEIGRWLIGQSAAAGVPLQDLRAGLLSASSILFPLGPRHLLEVTPDELERNLVISARRTVVEKHEDLIVRCRERSIVARSGHRLVTGTRPIVQRRRQMSLACVSTEVDSRGGTCIQGFGSVYAKEPSIALCGNHL